MIHAKNLAELNDPNVTEANPIDVRILWGEEVRTVKMHSIPTPYNTLDYAFEDKWGELGYYSIFELPQLSHHVVLQEIDAEYSMPFTILWDEPLPDFKLVKQIVKDLHAARPMSDTVNSITYENRMEMAMHLYSDIFVATYCMEAKNFHVDAAIAAIDAYVDDQVNRFNRLLNRVSKGMQALGIKDIKIV